jgi:DNA primase
MPGRIPDRFIDELLARVDVVDVIGSRLPLKRAGKEFQSRCPFHDERSASFTVSPNKQFYHCFGCGAHGTAIRFVMDYDGLEFVDAVESLAQHVGLKVPYEGGIRRDDGLDKVYEALADCSAFFRQQLQSSKTARDYLDRRGVSEALRETYSLGFAPEESDAFMRALAKDPERRKALQLGGMFSAGDRGDYAKFRNRVMFPISDRRGRPIAFGGRVMEKSEPKYLNSPETPLFHKGRELYGLYQAKQAVNKLKQLIVVEGYMDVIALAQYGVTEAVATLGTATSREHAELLFRNAEDVVFCFDGDRAGRAAAWRALQAVMPRMTDGRSAQFLFLPDGEDPDTLVRREGESGFRERIKSSMSLSEYFFTELSVDINLTNLEGRARLAEKANPLIAQIPESAFRDLMQAALRERTGAPARVSAPVAPKRKIHRPSAVTPSLVRTAIAHLIRDPRLAQRVEPPYVFAGLQRNGVDLLLQMLDIARAKPGITTGIFLENFSGHEQETSLSKLAATEIPGDEIIWRAEFDAAIAGLVEQTRKARIAQLIEKQVAGALDENDKNDLRQLLTAR